MTEIKNVAATSPALHRYRAWLFVEGADGELWLMEREITGLPIEPSRGMEIVMPGDIVSLTVDFVRVDLASGDMEIKFLDDTWEVKASKDAVEAYIAEHYSGWEIADGPA